MTDLGLLFLKAQTLPTFIHIHHSTQSFVRQSPPRLYFTMIGICSVYPFGVVIWQDVGNMSCKRWHDATMRFKDTKKTSIMATFCAM